MLVLPERSETVSFLFLNPDESSAPISPSRAEGQHGTLTGPV
jgi:hypothetical protein